MDDEWVFTLPGLESALRTGRETRILIGIEKEAVTRWLFARRFPVRFRAFPAFSTHRDMGIRTRQRSSHVSVRCLTLLVLSSRLGGRSEDDDRDFSCRVLLILHEVLIIFRDD
jgi:hypothetical protein